MATGSPELLKDAVVYLGAAVVAVPLFHRLKLGAVLGYLAAGLLIGPHALALVGDPESTLHFAEFGIVLLLFVIGLELRPSRLWQLRGDIFGLGLLQVLLCGLAITGVVLAATQLTWQASLVVGLPLALSSTALVIQLLEEREELNTPMGERSFSVLLFQDLAIVPLLTIVAALSRVPDPNAAPGWLQAVYTAAAIAGLAIAGRYLMNPLFRLIGELGAREAFVIAALLTVLGAAFLMASLGLSMALGAFVAGVMLAESPYRHELEADIEPFRGLLLGLFFISVGMTLDLGILVDRAALVLGLALAVMTVKTVLIAGLALLFGSPLRSALPMGLLLSQGGEFGFVLFGAAERGLLLSPQAASLFGAVVTMSMALTPILVRLLSVLPVSEREIALDGPQATDARRNVIIVGYGRFGQTVGQMLVGRGVDVTLIDVKPAQIELTGRFGVKVYYGDGRRIDVLRAAGAADADLMIFAADGGWLNAATLAPIRTAFPQARIIARAFDRRHWIELRKADVETIVREVFDSAVHMGREALHMLGTDPKTIDAIEEEYRRRDTERLSLQLASGDLMAGRELALSHDRPFATDAVGEIPFVGPIDNEVQQRA
jgi:monovalent cation:proton antiporter-2 (CPA2) family protein